MEEFQYKVTVVVPVYNAEEFLEDCIGSVINQTIDRSLMEIVLIDDGSADNSYKICAEYAGKYSFIQAYHKENEGVSSTRNFGIERARGKYILYIDADDALAPETIEEVTEFFDEHYDEVDLVTYKLTPVANGQEKARHYRYRILNRSGVYDLSVPGNIYISQTTMNICVKNLGRNNVLFDTTKSKHEDQIYCTEILMKKMKIGYCDQGNYLYKQHANSTVMTTFYAYYMFEETTAFWEDLFERFKADLPQYIQALYINDFNWKLKADILYPYHYEEDDYKLAVKRLTDLLDKVDDDVIINHPAIDSFHRAYYLKIKHDDIKIYKSGNSYAVCSGADTLWFIGEYFRVNINKVNILDDSLILSGHTICPLTEFGVPKLCIANNDRIQELDLEISSFSCHRSKVRTNTFYSFEYALPLSDSNIVRLSAVIGDNEYSVKFFFNERCKLNSKRRVYLQDGYIVRTDNRFSEICVDKADVKERNRMRRSLDRFYFSFDIRVFLYRKTSFQTSKKIWLYCDRKDVFDNAYIQFKHDFPIKDGVDRYYIVDGLEKPGKYFTRKERKKLVDFKSFKHKVLFMNCEKIITSFNSASIISPFGGRPMCWYSDLVKYEVIYLQHGVLHAKLPLMYSKERGETDRIVVSSQFEVDNFVHNYGFKEDDLILSGMPRYDRIDARSKPLRKILFSPSWRANLIGEYVNNTRELNDKAFLESDFYKTIHEFLNSPGLARLLEEQDLTLDFKNHPIFAGYNGHFDTVNPRVKVLSDEDTDIEKYLVMITDYSSFVFDFVYLERPVIYFVPDYTLFKAGVTHNYRELDLPLEDGFGEFTQTAEELLEALRKLAANDFRPAEQYAEKMKGFFLDKGKNHADMLYEAIKGRSKA